MTETCGATGLPVINGKPGIHTCDLPLGHDGAHAWNWKTMLTVEGPNVGDVRVISWVDDQGNTRSRAEWEES